MSKNSVIWVASYPRSGNTFLRTILWNCFGLHSASYYLNDLGGNKKLQEYVGHIEPDSNNRLHFPPNSLPLVKTHELSRDSCPAIYVVRDGRAAAVSLWKFYEEKFPLEEFIEGRHKFGKWSDHVQSWNPLHRPNTLLLRYEDMQSDYRSVFPSLSQFLNRDVLNDNIPDRSMIADEDGRWVKEKSNWAAFLPIDLINQFNEANSLLLNQMGYLLGGF